MPSSGEETVAFAREYDDVVEDIAEITGLSERTVKRRLAGASSGRTKVANLFSGEWPVTVEDFGWFTVSQLKRLGLVKELADAAGRTPQAVYARFRGRGGGTRISTVFADLIEEEAELEEEPPRRRRAARKRAKPAEREYASVLDRLLNAPDKDVRGATLELTSEFEVPGLYLHQEQCLEKMRAQGGSGIVHLPTGAGKTRLALTFIAEALREDPKRRFVWATGSIQLIRQAMRAAAEYGALFPSGTRVRWLMPLGSYDEDDCFDEAQIVFAMRDDLGTLLERAADRRRADPLTARLEARHEVIVVYDECHQLGAARLVRAWKKFHSRLTPAMARRFRTIGLSATPLPTNVKTHEFLGKVVFPPHGGVADDEWGMHVYHRVTNGELVGFGVLCEVNTHFQRRGIFEIPQRLLETVARSQKLTLRRKAKGDDLEKYAKRFNAGVMSDELVLGFLAEKLSLHLGALGKTLVFVPNVHAANVLVKLLAARIEPTKIAVVHSRLEEADADGELEAEEKDPNTIITEFKRRGDEPCVMVNVGMLTTGFDDPKIRTVILARLTFSTNLFWQMIGRGTRGPASGGTGDCYVIDPIRLLEKHSFAEGYRPNLEGGDLIEAGLDERGEGGLSPAVPAVDRAPSVSEAKPEITAQLRELNAKVVRTIEAFLAGQPVSRADLLDAADATHLVEKSDGSYALEPRRGEDDGSGEAERTGVSFLLTMLSFTEKKLGRDLSWMHRVLPARYSREAGEAFLTKLEIVEDHELFTESDFRAYENEVYQQHMNGGGGSAPKMQASPIPEHLIHDRLFALRQNLPTDDIAALREMVDDHAASLGGKDPARKVASAIHRMLDGYEELSADERAKVVSAAYYFVEEEDAMPDSGNDGLADDIRAVNYIARALGRPDLFVD